MNDEVYLWDADKNQNFLQVVTIILSLHCQGCPKYPE